MKRIEIGEQPLPQVQPSLRQHSGTAQPDDTETGDNLPCSTRRGAAVAKEGFKFDPAALARKEPGERRGGISGGQGLEFGNALGRAALAFGRAQIVDDATAQGAACRPVAQDEAVARHGDDRSVEDQLGEARLAGGQGPVAKVHDMGGGLGGSMMKAQGLPLAQGFAFGGQQLHGDIDARGRRMQGGIDQGLAAADGCLGNIRPGNGQGAALSGAAPLRFAVLGVDRAHPGFKTGRRDQQPVADAHRARDNGAGHHGSRPRQVETPVDIEPETVLDAARGRRGARLVESRDELFQSLSGLHGNGNDGGAGQAGSGQKRADIGAHFAAALFAGEIGLGQGDDATAQAEQIEDRQMLAGLRHDAVIGRHGEQHEVDAGGAGQHVVDQRLVARHIDEADDIAIGAGPIGITQIDGDAALLFLRGDRDRFRSGP
jgi:hypothetical protein